MIYAGTILKVIDNSGAKFVRCLKVLGNKGGVGVAGSPIVVSVREVNPKKRIKKGEIYRAILVGTRKSRLRANGVYVWFGFNCVVIVSNKNIPLATRLLGPVMLDVRESGFLKVVSMSTRTI